MIADIISLLFILPGAFMVFSAAVGTARFNSTLARVHAITKPQTTGLVLMITGTIILSLIHNSEPTRRLRGSRMPSSA